MRRLRRASLLVLVAGAIVTAAAATPAKTLVATAGNPPVNTAQPTIAGTAQQGQLLTAGPGAWSGTTPITYAYQWQRCDATGANCASIAGATAATYTVVATDVSSTLVVTLTASNSDGSSSASSAPTVKVVPLPPSYTAPPSVTGIAQDKQKLTATKGTWSSVTSISYSYRWLRCDTTGAACSSISGATSSTYTLTSSDVGKTDRVRVTATNSGGSTSADSAPTGIVQALPPTNTALPTISGMPQDTMTLTAGKGTWTGSSLVYSYAWLRCGATGATCNPISGATSSTYKLTSNDIGATIRISATADNSSLPSGGTASATSAATVAVVALPPANTAVPTISGTAQEGKTLTAANGTWKGSTPLSFSYQWRRCDLSGASCTDLVGANGPTYAVATGDVGSTLRVAVTADNSSLAGGGTALAVSASTSAVNPAAPTNTLAPSISGNAVDGQTLTAATGSWTSATPPSYAFQWRRCDSTGSSCSSINGATSSTYTEISADVKSTIRVRVTATNSGGSTSADSSPTAVVQAIPAANVTAPTIGGTAQDKQKLTAGNGTWSGSTPLTYSYRWLRCNATGSTCTSISGATSSTYTLTSSDVGTTTMVRVTASNASLPGGAAAVATSAATSLVQALAPANTVAPTISGTPQAGQTLTAAKGTWTGSSPITYTYQWQRCDTTGGNCADITAATGTTRLLSVSDIDTTLRVRVKADNSALPGGGIATATSAATAVVKAAPPTNTAAPTIIGTPRKGATLTATTGTWSGTSPLAYSYQWQRCNVSASGCDTLPATAPTYTLTDGDVGTTLRIAVTADNSSLAGGGSSTAASAPTASVDPHIDPVIGAAGDIACDPADPNYNGGAGTKSLCHAAGTAQILANEGLDGVLTLGDDQYDCAGLAAFNQSYDASWGRVKAITYPVPGNHEYATSGGTDCDATANAGGYFSYFGATAGTPGQGYYSFDIGTWHIIALNTNDDCTDLSCDANSAQEQWLRQDLASHPALCTLAFWHHPLFSSKLESLSSLPFWQDLYAAGADVILNGHVHAYERFVPQAPDGTADPANGIREFVVGTGGKSLETLGSPVANSEVRNSSAYGVLELTLHAGSYDWKFATEPGSTFTDSGSTPCH
jgi:hypothetical protein